MQSFDSGTAVIFVALQQRLAEFFDEIDNGMGRRIDAFYASDGVFLVGGRAHTGHAEIGRFYADRERRILAEQKDGVRSSRHVFGNTRIEAAEADRAIASFVLVNFSGEGRPPLFGLTTPTVVADCRMAFQRDEDGVWRIARFESQPIFVGNDPFLNKAVVKR